MRSHEHRARLEEAGIGKGPQHTPGRPVSGQPAQRTLRMQSQELLEKLCIQSLGFQRDRRGDHGQSSLSGEHTVIRRIERTYV